MKKVYVLMLAIILLGLSSFQIISTQLKITVINNLGKTEEGVRVRLFKTEEDYNTEKNIVQEHYTDKKGVVIFKNLEAREYYINAVKDNKTNAGNGEKTEVLKDRMITKVTVVIQE
jgi:uncharacterized protein (DUF2141 family)